MTTAIQNTGDKSRLMMKTAAVGVALLLLQIPACQVRNLTAERSLKQQQAHAEVSRKCTGQQAATRSALLFPFLLAVSDTNTHSIADTPGDLAAFDQQKFTIQTKNF